MKAAKQVSVAVTLYTVRISVWFSATMTEDLVVFFLELGHDRFLSNPYQITFIVIFPYHSTQCSVSAA